MILARVIGEVVATQKHASQRGLKLLLVEPEAWQGLSAQGASGAGLIALDAVGAGVGERVLVVLDGYAAMTAVGRPQSPIDAAVVGIVDHTDAVTG
ncbi:MAG TPA: EutN/CcmL family microcompartment protein [Terriglobales bacterium]|nr:EutN/CcmL family microcompartment protein [Terriglobales bacterium]